MVVRQRHQVESQRREELHHIGWDRMGASGVSRSVFGRNRGLPRDRHVVGGEPAPRICRGHSHLEVRESDVGGFDERPHAAKSVWPDLPRVNLDQGLPGDHECDGLFRSRVPAGCTAEGEGGDPSHHKGAGLCHGGYPSFSRSKRGNALRTWWRISHRFISGPGPQSSQSRPRRTTTRSWEGTTIV